MSQKLLGDAHTVRPLTMRAMVQREYGPFSEVLTLEEIPRPTPGPDEVLIRVHASSVNAMEWHLMSGVPLLFRPIFGVLRPKERVFGADVSGVVDAVGSEVVRFVPGDAVFGEIHTGAYAEYVVANEKLITHKPESVGFEDAAAVGVAGLTALQFLRDVADLQPGHKLLVNGASGGVGTYAIQIGKHLGADVTAVCSTRNVEQAYSLGADRVVDYTRDDILESDERFDVILDIAGLRSLRATKGIMSEGGSYCLVGGPKGRWAGPLPRFALGFAFFAFTSQSLKMHTAQSRSEDLSVLGELLATGAIRSVIDQRYPLADLAIPLERQGTFHSRAKTVINVQGVV